MRLIHHQQAIGGQIVKQRRRRFARSACGEVARVVFDAGAVTQLTHHLQVKLSTLGNTLLFQQLIVLQQHPAAVRQLDFDVFHRLQNALTRRDVVRFGVDGKTRHH